MILKRDFLRPCSTQIRSPGLTSLLMPDSKAPLALMLLATYLLREILPNFIPTINSNDETLVSPRLSALFHSIQRSPFGLLRCPV
jgi:hypothetical protein